MQQSDQDIRNRLLIARLPAMPQILIKLLDLLQTDSAGIGELATLIGQDAGMTGKILSVANSSAYHRNGSIVGLEQSLAALGTDMIKTLVISESVFQTFNNFPHSASTDLRKFWKHSLSAAVMARAIARKMDYPHPEEAYLAGLLHDVGRLALLAAAPRDYAFNFAASDDEGLCAVEQRTLQITHSEAGAWLIERWHLDSFLADSVLYHHEPVARLESAHALIRIVRLAHLLDSGEPDPLVWADGTRLCALEPDDLAAIVAAAAQEVTRAAHDLGIDLSGADDVVLASAGAMAAPTPDPVQQRLSEEVRNLFMASELGQSFARQPSQAGLLESMTRSARILFDFGSTIVLLKDPTGHALVGSASGEQQRLAGFSLALAQGGPIAQAALEQRPCCVSRDGQALAVGEQQLFRMLGSESLVCLPLVAGQRCLGLLIGAVGALQVPSLQRRARLLQSFGAQAGSALELAVSARAHAQRQLEDVAEQYREASRQVVHEVNNPLSIIKNYLSVLDDKLAKSEPVAGEMAVLNEEIDRVGQLINGLADLEPSAAADSEVTDLGRVVDQVLALFRATDFVPPSVSIRVQMQAGPAEIEGDAGILKQILLNLIKNAVEAMPQGGTIEIGSRGFVKRERQLYLELCISDSAAGLPDAVLENLFAPVASAKDGAHHGLGLSIVHSLVTKLHGLITCRSGAAGTTFEILLPARNGASPARAPQARIMDSV